jgi:ubiquinone/menaquinone biosynthesis C-methylase UbiE
MSFYRDRILPHLVHMAMRQETLLPYRRRATQAAMGRVLEVGVGSGLNLPLYGEGVTEVIGVDPSPQLLAMARGVARGLSRSIELLEGSAEAIPLDGRTIDTVVTTWTLCTIAAVGPALGEMRRVLKPDGRLVFVEHGLSPSPNVRWWQDRLTPLWKRIGGGCHLNRPIRQLIEGSGFRIEQVETGYLEGPKPMTFTYEGHARPM